MVTAIAAPSHPPIIFLPPAPPRHGLAFDKGMRVKSSHFAVQHARFDADGDAENATNIDYSDYGRMQTQQHKLEACRQDYTPEWVLNDSMMRKVLVRYLEARAFSHQHRRPESNNLSEFERLARAEKKLQADIPAKQAILTDLAKKYVELKKQGADAARLLMLARQIENLDTVIVTAKNIAAKVLMCAHLYYRLGLSSVEVGAEVSMKPPHVREILWRLRKVAATLGYANPPQKRIRRAVHRIEGLCRACGAPRPRVRGRRFCERCSAARQAAYAKGQRRLDVLPLKPSMPARAKIVVAPSKPKCRTIVSGPRLPRQEIVSSPEFIALFEKARGRMQDPNRKTCAHGHLITAANAHVGDLRRLGKYHCNECWQQQQQRYLLRNTAR